MTPLEVMRERGFGKGSGAVPPSDGTVCILSAMSVAEWWLLHENGRTYRHMVEAVILAEFPERLEHGAVSIHGFNDHPDTTFEDVERVLEKTEAILAERGLL